MYRKSAKTKPLPRAMSYLEDFYEHEIVQKPNTDDCCCEFKNVSLVMHSNWDIWLSIRLIKA